MPRRTPGSGNSQSMSSSSMSSICWSFGKESTKFVSLTWLCLRLFASVRKECRRCFEDESKTDVGRVLRRKPDSWSGTRQLFACNAQYNDGCYRRLIASGVRECRRSFEGENKTVTLGEECVQNPIVEVEPVSCWNAMRNTMVGVTGDCPQAVAGIVVGPFRVRTKLWRRARNAWKTQELK